MNTEIIYISVALVTVEVGVGEAITVAVVSVVVL